MFIVNWGRKKERGKEINLKKKKNKPGGNTVDIYFINQGPFDNFRALRTIHRFTGDVFPKKFKTL